jgi:Bifunctional DNA primase/polymerase, N-terminal
VRRVCCASPPWITRACPDARARTGPDSPVTGLAVSIRAAAGRGAPTASPEVIRAALSRGLRNLGIDCGKSGLLVVDRPGAFASYAASTGHVLPVTFTITTGKGRHVYFRQLPGLPLGNSIGALAGRGIDVRGNGGFVVGPGSVRHTGVRHTPVDATAPVVPAPD